MKKRLTAIFLALALCLGLTVPVSAADDKAAQAIAAYQGIIASPPSLEGRYYTSYKCCGSFYLDFDKNGVPELVLVYNYGSMENVIMVVYYYDGTARKVATGYPDVYTRGYSSDELLTSVGGSGGAAGQIVRFSDGTYGLRQYAFGFSTTSLTVKFSGNALVPAGTNGSNVYTPHLDKLPSLNQFYTPPAKPADGSADFDLSSDGTIVMGYHGPGGSVTVPGTVKKIGVGAFGGTNITSITIPAGVTTIDENAFIDCAKLTSVSLPSSLREIGDWAFKGTGLTGITIPAGVTAIGHSTFLYCKNLTSVSLPSGLKKIDSWAFARSGLTNATIPASVTSIGDWAFAYCTSLTRLVIENGDAAIGECAFVYMDASDSEILGNIPVTVYAPAGGAVERYCKANNIPFQAMNFTDVAVGQWYAKAVNWAVEKEITNGTGNGKFSPSRNCTHAEILTFLYRAARGSGAAAAEDMDKAVAWAREKGMIGQDFNGKTDCTRADAVNYIWQAFGRQDAKAGSFTDVPAGAAYAKAVNWAVANGITNGTNAAGTQFSPNKVCDRGTIVTFLHRAYVPEARLPV